MLTNTCAADGGEKDERGLEAAVGFGAALYNYYRRDSVFLSSAGAIRVSCQTRVSHLPGSSGEAQLPGRFAG